MTDKKRKWTPKQIAIFEEFHNKAMSEIIEDKTPEEVFKDKPEGYTEWVKENFEKTGGIRFPNLDDKPKTICWNCKKEYPVSFHKCSYCGSYNPKANINQ